MITLDVAQGSPEWFAARCGIPTASNFDKIVTSKGEPSKSATKYIWQLAAERIIGKTEESYQNPAMLRGIEMESEAVALYEMIKCVDTTEVGICYLDETKSVAASPDRLVGKQGLLEIKCPLNYTHVGYLLDPQLPTDYFQQAQGQLYVTGCWWLDFMSYYPGIKPLIVRVERDEKFISALESELKKFCSELDRVTEKIR